MKQNIEKWEVSSKPTSTYTIPFPDNIDVDDEVWSEDHANVVRNSPVFKNTLAISKGSPRKGFKVEDLPEVSWFNSNKESRSVSFKVYIWKPVPSNSEVHEVNNKNKIQMLIFKGNFKILIMLSL